jgi:hypothetical protein
LRLPNYDYTGVYPAWLPTGQAQEHVGVASALEPRAPCRYRYLGDLPPTAVLVAIS